MEKEQFVEVTLHGFDALCIDLEQVFVGTCGPIGSLFEPSADSKVRRAGGCSDVALGTLLVVESGVAVLPTKPEDVNYLPDGPLPKLGGRYKEGFLGTIADGSTRFLGRDLDDELIRSLSTRNGGAPVEWTKWK